MQLLVRALFYIVLALLVWVGDAAILSIFREGSSFLSCLFVDVSVLRVLVRASLSALCLIWGWHRVRPLLPASGVLNCVVGEVDAQKRGGSAESHLRSQRLLYHALQLANAYHLPEEEKQGNTGAQTEQNEDKIRKEDTEQESETENKAEQVKNATNNPKTGDNILTSVMLFVISIATIGALTIVKRKKSKTNAVK